VLQRAEDVGPRKGYRKVVLLPKQMAELKRIRTNTIPMLNLITGFFPARGTGLSIWAG
jgi:hypothetical protein